MDPKGHARAPQVKKEREGKGFHKVSRFREWACGCLSADESVTEQCQKQSRKAEEEPG